MKIGTDYLGDGQCKFTVWSPLCDRVAVHIISPTERLIELERDRWGYWHGQGSEIEPGTLYFYQLDGTTDRADPASHSQPEGVHKASQVVDHNFIWNDRTWSGIPLAEMIIYELHVGTFTPEGTFEAIISKLPDLLDLGVNTIEIMPIAQFPGERNWGYDGTYLFAPQHSYGGANGLKKLVNACHEVGMSVILDVVYNHLGPEGNYLWSYGKYFTDKYQTPWGSAVNFDGPYSNEVRNFFIENTLYWLDLYHIDGLRLDAVHAIYDMSAKPFLQELAERVSIFSQETGRDRYIIAESDLNDVRVIRSREQGGFGHDSQWCDDFHHSLHTLLTGEISGYYSDYGQIDDLEKSFREAFVYTGEYSQHRQRNHGNSTNNFTSQQFVVFSQNHDQIGNRLAGERLSTLIDFEGLKLAAGTVLLSPYIPLLFMGEEYGEEAPFLYFVSHGDSNLIESVRNGRAEEFKAFGWDKEIPDPQSTDVFLQSKLNWGLAGQGKHQVLRSLYKLLIKIRKESPEFAKIEIPRLAVSKLDDKKVLWHYRTVESSHLVCIMNFEKQSVTFAPQLPQVNWEQVLDSSGEEWMGGGSALPKELQSGDTITMNPLSFALYRSN
ncbi:malto-oligosyltrehalose trehalohydrolase [Limnofasciculus baicalensis]|uniref:Malto-oligosyltrehalose trehalohydrolase n=1 Tax=Limnofasciculus baicalensis BBK-W-15 TaxID=2699891 RepID=A0AAE3GRQ0_9CYAN|nr:malto-oligosyltrehalose trehalohydrolase [Limnofasciculus baicalensis]MCP2728721.1 malto-oligosyltrehalose trehalohydrolase [Limnofasciculus baicalensis BBK-W-15]